MASPAEGNPSRLEAENRRLRRAVEELSILNEIASAVTSTYSLDKIVDLIVQKCVKHLSVEQGAVLLFGEKEESGALKTMIRRVQSDLRPIPYRMSDQLTGWMLKNQAPLVINDLAQDGRFRIAGGEQTNIHSLMCVPLRQKGRMIGVLSVFNKHSAEGFTDSDQRLLTIIGAQSAQVIENARLYEEEKALQQIQQELRMASEIQNNLLPKQAPRLPGYDIAGNSVPARNVGGDYFDFIDLEDGRLTLCLGDVSGKGMPAAVLMASVQATVRGQCLVGPDPSPCVERSNKLLHNNTDSDKFVTLFYAILDPANHQLRYSNAGHNPPILLPDQGEPRELKAGGPVLGVLPSSTFQEASETLGPGDLLVIYSDGFTEAMDENYQEFGEERLLEVVRSARRQKAAAVITKLQAAAKQHFGKSQQNDDMTLIVVRREY